MLSDTEKEACVLLGLDGFSARGIVRALGRVQQEGGKATTGQVYRALRKRGVRLWEVRHCETPEAERRAVRLVVPVLRGRRRRAG